MKIKNLNNIFNGSELVEAVFPNITSSLGFQEYDAVLNNSETNISSSFIMKAEYNSAKIPDNFNKLVQGTAEKLTINDSTYLSYHWKSPRYDGSKVTSANINKYSPSGSNILFSDGTIGSWNGDQNLNTNNFKIGNPLGKVPTIDLFSTHMILFDKIEINEGFDNTDIFHCLFLIDDEGNKVPLTYNNENINYLQKLFKPGSNTEVIFLGPNNQNISDFYPIVRSGEKFISKLELKNDAYIILSTGGQVSLSPLNFSYFRTPLKTWTLDNGTFLGFLTASQGANGNINISQSSTPLNINQLYGAHNINQNEPASSTSADLSFWFSILYNPTTNKLFEGTELEQPLATEAEFIGFQYSALLNGQSDFINPGSFITEFSPIKPGDTLILSAQATSSVIDSTIPPFPVASSFDIQSYFTPDAVYDFKVQGIQFPGPISMSYTSTYNYNPNNPAPANVGDYGWIVTWGSNGTALMQGQGFGGLPTLTSGYSNVAISIRTASLNGRSASMDESIWFPTMLNDLNMGDLIKIRRWDQPNNEALYRKYMVLRNEGLVTTSIGGNNNCYKYLIQLLPSNSSPYELNYDVPLATLQSKYEIYEIKKYGKPYLEVSPYQTSLTAQEINSSINLTSSFWTFKHSVPHEQYIESQYLVGSGVGVLLPEDYSPELRKIIPDIILKTKIDVGNLIQNQ